MQKWRGMHKGLPDAPKRSRYRVRKGWHRVLFENSAKHPHGSSGKDSPKSGKTYRHAEDAEDSATRIPFSEMGARHHYRTGWFEKFLLSRVGRSWDTVYSEIRQGLDYRNGAQAKTLKQILRYVEIKCWIDADGEIYSASNGRPWLVYNDFYVHPETGILEYSDNTLGRKQERLVKKLAYEKKYDHGCKIVDSSDRHNYLYRDYSGVWFAARTEECTITDEYKGDYFEFVRNCTAMMQLSRHELARCGLENEFTEFMEFAYV